ncbi:MAG TPA: FHA domain-containing protein, partial [Pyrinomonadaceae bacterium]|nr:FHA domain-containing protein [Pyrinomonadaceae bacterium]
MSAKIKISEPGGSPWEMNLDAGNTYTIGRSKENSIVLNDRRVSRKHAHIVSDGNGVRVVDGFYEAGILKRSVNHVFVNGSPVLEKPLSQGDTVMIGETQLAFLDALPQPFIPEHHVSYAPAIPSAPVEHN